MLAHHLIGTRMTMDEDEKQKNYEISFKDIFVSPTPIRIQQ